MKLNPTLLGPADVRALLHDALGYTELRVPDDAFTKDTQWDQAAAFLDRLDETARSLGLSVGVKLTNTLIVENHRDFFPRSEPVMYLSGRPLHALAMHLVRRVRRAFGDRFPISFSAGIERANFPDAVALGLVPITVSSDLLQPGGYARPYGYFDELHRRMDAAGASSVDELVLAYAAAPLETSGSRTARLSAAKVRNTELYVERVTRDPRYGAARNRKVPRKIGRRLRLFDCLTCDKCIPACPNDANFTFSMASTPDVPVTEERQIGNFADFCNDCGNCDTFCPEEGGPFQPKPRFFVSRERWQADAPRDAILVERDAITGRFDGRVVRVVVGADGAVPSDDPHVRILRRLREAVLAAGEINYVNQSLAEP